LPNCDKFAVAVNDLAELVPVLWVSPFPIRLAEAMTGKQDAEE
jgi:hypothetical protein